AAGRDPQAARRHPALQARIESQGAGGRAGAGRARGGADPGDEGVAPVSEHQPENLPATAPGGDIVQPPPAEVVDHRRGMFGVPGPGDTSGYGGLRRDVQLPAGSAKPYGGWYDAVAERMGNLIGDDAIEKVVVDRGE